MGNDYLTLKITEEQKKIILNSIESKEQAIKKGIDVTIKLTEEQFDGLFSSSTIDTIEKINDEYELTEEQKDTLWRQFVEGEAILRGKKKPTFLERFFKKS